MTQPYGPVLRNRPLAAFLGGDLVSKTGDGMLVVALPVLAIRIRGDVDAAFAVALAVAAPFVLSVALGIGLGLSRVRFEPRRLLLVDCALRATVFVALGLLARREELGLWMLVPALLFGSVLRSAASSARRLLVTGMTDGENRLAANSLLGINDSFGLYVVGPVIGGVLVGTVGPWAALVVDGVTFVLLGLLVVTTAPRPGTAAAAPATDRPQSGWTVLRRTPGLGTLLAVVFLFMLLYGPVEVALPLFVTGDLRGSAALLGALWTAFGVGALLGAAATAYLRRLPQETLLVALVPAWGLSLLAVGAAEHPVWAAVAFATGGVIWAPFIPVMYSLIQDRLAEDDQQPVVTIWGAMINIAAPVGILFGGPLVALAGARGALLLSAGSTIALTAVAASGIRRLRRPSPARAARKAAI